MRAKISIIYVYYNTPKEITDSINSIKQAIGKFPFEIIVVDNNSLIPFPKKKIKIKITCIKNKVNVGFGSAVNIATKKATGKYLCIINPDTILLKNSLKDLCHKAEIDQKIGIISPQLLDKQKNILQSINQDPQGLLALFSFSILNKLLPDNPYSKKYWLRNVDRKSEQIVDVVGGACLFLKRKLFNEIGGFDERFFMYFEESDICYRIRQKGYKIVYYPKAKIIHFIGRSSTNKTWIEKQFERSRLRYLQKYHGAILGFLIESMIRFLQPISLLLSFVLIVSTFLNLYKINSLMMFFGDFGRDYLAARDLIVYHKVPLEGIQSSVVWLNQGPLSIYFIALALYIGNFSPYAPAVLYGLLGVLTTLVVYKIGKIYFSKKIGLISAAFYTTSPLIVITSRMPYHVSPIPFFAALCLIFTQKFIDKNGKFLPIALFFWGILLLLEISNIVLFFVFFIIFFLYRSKFSSKQVLLGIVILIVCLSPFFIYDIQHNFLQSRGVFTALAKHITRITLVYSPDANYPVQFRHALQFTWDQFTRILFPRLHFIPASLLLVFFLLTFVKRKKLFIEKEFVILLLWIFVPLILYILRGSASPAYFPVIFPAVAVLFGLLSYSLFSYNKIFILLFILLVVWNGKYVIYNNYFLNTNNKNVSNAVGWNYGLGTALSEQELVAKTIVKNSDNESFILNGKGTGFNFPTDADNYRYLAWYYSKKKFTNAKIHYTLYSISEKHIQDKVIYKDKFIMVTRQ